MPAIPQISVKDADVQRALDQIVAAIDPLVALALLGGRVIENVTFVGGAPKAISHGLMKKVRWYVVRQDAWARFREDTTNKLADRFLLLTADDNVTADLFVFPF